MTQVVEEGEALGFLEALLWVKSLGLDNGIIEGDAKVVVNGINSSKAYNSVFGDFVVACRELVNSFQQINITFLRRSANVVAHEIARASRLYENYFCWVDPLDYVVGLPTSVCTCNNEI
ncbi:hypothetical protein ACS0TY_005652 [Phlomoides rotata]